MRLLTRWRTRCKGMVENALHLKVWSKHLRASACILQTKQDRSHLKVVRWRKEEHDQHLDTDPKKTSGASSLISATPDFSMLFCRCINWELDIYVPYKMRFPASSSWNMELGRHRQGRASHWGTAEDRDACSPLNCLGHGAFTQCVN